MDIFVEIAFAFSWSSSYESDGLLWPKSLLDQGAIWSQQAHHHRWDGWGTPRKVSQSLVYLLFSEVSSLLCFHFYFAFILYFQIVLSFYQKIGSFWKPQSELWNWCGGSCHRRRLVAPRIWGYCCSKGLKDYTYCQCRRRCWFIEDFSSAFWKLCHGKNYCLTFDWSFESFNSHPSKFHIFHIHSFYLKRLVQVLGVCGLRFSNSWILWACCRENCPLPSSSQPHWLHLCSSIPTPTSFRRRTNSSLVNQYSWLYHVGEPPLANELFWSL